MSLDDKIARDPGFQVNVYMSALRILLRNPIIEQLQATVACYKIDKDPSWNNQKYTQVVSDCNSKVKEQSIKRIKVVQDTISEFKKIQADHDTRTYNCNNIFSETEIMSCKKDETENYIKKLRAFYLKAQNDMNKVNQ